MRVRWVIALLSVFVLWSMMGIGVADGMSREELDTLWEQLLREERYEGINYHSRSSTPLVSDLSEKRVGKVHHLPTISVQDSRETYLWGLLGGLSGGGGWGIKGQLEAEVSIEGARLQLYSKETIKWRPGLFPIWDEVTYDPKKYPIREFRLILRHPVHRQQIRTVKSVFVQPAEVLPTSNPDGTSVMELLGQRIPRGELQYDPARNVAVVRILGLHHPITEEVTIPSPPFADSPGP